MKISDGQPKISDSLKISGFSDSLGCCNTPKHRQQYAYVYLAKHTTANIDATFSNV